MGALRHVLFKYVQSFKCNVQLQLHQNLETFAKGIHNEHPDKQLNLFPTKTEELSPLWLLTAILSPLWLLTAIFMHTCNWGRVFSSVANTSMGFHSTTAMMNTQVGQKSFQSSLCFHSRIMLLSRSPLTTWITLPKTLPGPSLGFPWTFLDLSLNLLGPSLEPSWTFL